MPEQKVIPSSTVTSIVGTDITILTRYREESDVNILPDTILAFITNQTASYDGVSHVEGELIIEMKNNPLQIDYSIDSDGNLIVFSNQGDESNYSIDNQTGQLVYTD